MCCGYKLCLCENKRAGTGGQQGLTGPGTTSPAWEPGTDSFIHVIAGFCLPVRALPGWSQCAAACCLLKLVTKFCCVVGRSRERIHETGFFLGGGGFNRVLFLEIQIKLDSSVKKML